MKRDLSKITGILAAASLSLALLPCNSIAKNNEPPTASVHGKYRDLIQELNCPADAEKYGKFKDYGYWQGGAWCGKMGAAGYWVWLKPTWYVWRAKKN